MDEDENNRENTCLYLDMLTQCPRGCASHIPNLSAPAPAAAAPSRSWPQPRLAVQHCSFQ
jgi:hypothetical protein